MPPTDSGSDGENGEKPVRERLKQTTIDKSADGEVVENETIEAEMEGSATVENVPVKNVHGTVEDRPAKKRTHQAVNDADQSQDSVGGAPDTPSSGGHLRKRYREGMDVAKAEDENLNHDQDFNKDVKTGLQEGKESATTVKMQTPPPETVVDPSSRVLSPKKRRSRDDLDEDDREQKIQATEETRARRSSEEERPVLENGKATPKEVENGKAIKPETESKSLLGSKPVPASSGFANTSAVSPFGTLAGSKSPPATTTIAETAAATSSSAFASSGFASMTSSTSPFGSIGTSSQAKSSKSSQPATFGSLAGAVNSSATTSTTTSSFGSTKPSGFGSFGSSAFGSNLSSNLGSGPRLTSFAAAVGDTKLDTSTKPKPIGSPQTKSKDDDDASDEENDGNDDEDDSADPSATKSPEPETKYEIQENHDTGETGEETLFSLPAGKLYVFDPDGPSWKERGVGAIKINVPKTDEDKKEAEAKDEDEDESTDNSEDKSTSEGKKIPRIIMRQRDTHKLILNTPIFKEMSLKREGKKLTFKAPTDSDNPRIVPLLIRVGKEQELEKFIKKIEELQDTV